MIQVKTLFSDFLGIPNTVGSDQPWRPPQCGKMEKMDSIFAIILSELFDDKGGARDEANLPKKFTELKRNYTKGMFENLQHFYKSVQNV